MIKIQIRKLIFIATIAVFVSLVFSQSSKKFTLDELDFPIVANATSQSGKPIYYRGEDSPNHIGIYHPPLYIYSLATYIKLFGFSENSVRSFGLLTTLLTAFLTVTLGRVILKDKDSIFVPIFMLLYLTNPYTTANTTLPDIDQTVLPPLIIGFILLLSINSKDKYLILIFTSLLWSKLTTPLALIPFSFFWWINNGYNFKHSFIRCAKVFGSSLLLFIATYRIFCFYFELNFDYTFKFLAHSFSKGSGSPSIYDTLNKVLSNFTLSDTLFSYVLYPFIILYAASLMVTFAKKFSNDSNLRNIWLLSIFPLFVTLFYLGLIAPFGGFFKYPFPVFSLFCLTIATVSAKIFSENSTTNRIGLILISGASFIIAIASHINNPLDHKELANYIANEYNNSPEYVYLSAVLIAVIIFNFKKTTAILLFITLGATIGIGLGVSRDHALSKYPTKYNYGQVGMDETIGYLKSNLNENEVIWSMKDVGFYSGNKYIESYSYLFDSNVEASIQNLKNKGVRYFVATKGIGEDNLEAYPRVQKALDFCCTLEKNFGNYYIYRAKDE